MKHSSQFSGLTLGLLLPAKPPKNQDNKKTATFVTVSFSVGVTGFEPATLCSQSRCATGLRYAPKMNSKIGGGERGIRTPGTVSRTTV